ncbi:MAG: tRNA (adenosine(37)-N6)-threonylcarbamoyltransferase complex dimerization subunit type 1 TsaB [Elusimicrobia bacterium]|nr:tRNA (adenosine(37)-N6)-threonylcarbamoyltransferase complex dimerization subunit type 1 TsaB [Elusimicrobiota bacterium]
MKILAIETTGEICGAALIDNNKIISERNLLVAKNSSSKIFEVVKEISKKLDFDCLAVDIGPGSFTGIRIGVSLARAYGQFLKVPVIGISSLDCLVYSALIKEKVIGHIFPIIDALRDEVFTAEYQGLKRKTGYQIIKIDKFRNMLSKGSVAAGSDEICGKIGLNGKCICTRMTASAVGFLAIKKFKNNFKGDYRKILPLYVRRSFAEEHIGTKR